MTFKRYRKKTASEFLEIALGGNLNIKTLKLRAWHEIMTDYAKYYHKSEQTKGKGETK